MCATEVSADWGSPFLGRKTNLPRSFVARPEATLEQPSGVTANCGWTGRNGSAPCKYWHQAPRPEGGRDKLSDGERAFVGVGCTSRTRRRNGWHQPSEIALLAPAYELDAEPSAVDLAILQRLLSVGFVAGAARVPQRITSAVSLASEVRIRRSAPRLARFGWQPEGQGFESLWVH